MRGRWWKRGLAGAGVAWLAVGAAAAPMALAREASSAPDDAAVSVDVDDEDDLVPADREEELIRQTREIPLPPEVTHVEYLVFGDNDDNINDTVEERLREASPELIGEDVYADGVLVLAYGDDPRSNGAYAGEDVADRLELREGRHLDETIEAMRPAMEDERIADGFVDGLRYAADGAAIEADRIAGEESDRRNTRIGVGVGVGAVGLAAAGGGYFVVSERKKKARRAREDHEYVTKHYADAGTRLDEIDVRAHNLSSPLANDELRRQWEEVRDGFLAVHEVKQRIGDPTDDGDFRAAADDLSEARESIERVRVAEDNIDLMWDMEQGDASARRDELLRLRDDLVRAQADVSDGEVRRRLADLEQRVRALGDDAESPSFMDDYADVLHDYRLVLDLVREREFDGLELGGDRTPPALWDPQWRVGSGYAGWMPFMMMHTWHQSDVAAAEASSATSSSYSSGFSGAGGGGRF
ncbi:DUF5129 domain-containing protein [uncultured Corynebacterium sp.]|uniref:DUF5129 domain-containing protein n=1 Tax=uncultured Corynebacterium sp. TaxID=159447 RepID=UPI0025D7CCBD|nr:DUF5129 domain-containing protein [uncultured Corynebacterium sp.]